jgi:hypothetical protein
MLALAAPALLALAAAAAHGQALGTVRESAVKAAFLYKFGSFVEWPPGTFRAASAQFVIGVYSDDAVASELEQITEGRAIEGHPVRVQRVRDRDDLAPLHILFAGGTRASRARELLAAARGPVLTVADAAIGGDPGPVLFFTEDEGRVRFGASLTAAAAHGLKLSSKLLAVAQKVEGR